ncbi:hypothetical protein HDU96_000147 [Phlyctochytrium bullatum]|nr:hypothetical protein HDU96_000147 [Phlyctochytrium bullatum]
MPVMQHPQQSGGVDFEVSSLVDQIVEDVNTILSDRRGTATPQSTKPVVELAPWTVSEFTFKALRSGRWDHKVAISHVWGNVDSDSLWSSRNYDRPFGEMTLFADGNVLRIPNHNRNRTKVKLLNFLADPAKYDAWLDWIGVDQSVTDLSDQIFHMPELYGNCKVCVVIHADETSAVALRADGLAALPRTRYRTRLWTLQEEKLAPVRIHVAWDSEGPIVLVDNSELDVKLVEAFKRSGRMLRDYYFAVAPYVGLPKIPYDAPRPVVDAAIADLYWQAGGPLLCWGTQPGLYCDGLNPERPEGLNWCPLRLHLDDEDGIDLTGCLDWERRGVGMYLPETRHSMTKMPEGISVKGFKVTLKSVEPCSHNELFAYVGPTWSGAWPYLTSLGEHWTSAAVSYYKLPTASTPNVIAVCDSTEIEVLVSPDRQNVETVTILLRSNEHDGRYRLAATEGYRYQLGPTQFTRAASVLLA